MALKDKNKKSNYSPTKDILGISIILVSALSLLCMIFPLLLGYVVGNAIKGFLTGVFGLSAYALFLSSLISGILLIMNKPVNIRPKYVICIVVVFISALSILHFATSSNLLAESFGGYASKCYKSGLTAGGVIVSLLVYPLYSITNKAFVYIFYSLILAGCVLVFTDFKFISYFKRVKQPKEDGSVKMFLSGQENDPAPRESAQTQQFMPPQQETRNSLYIENIYNPKPSKQSNKTYDNKKQTEYSQNYKEFGQKPESIFDIKDGYSYNQQAAKVEDYKKSEAYQRAAKELFGNHNNSSDSYYSDQGNSKYNFQAYKPNNKADNVNNNIDNTADYAEKYREFERDSKMPPKSTGAPDIINRDEAGTQKQPRPPKYFHNSAQSDGRNYDSRQADNKQSDSRNYDNRQADNRQKENNAWEGKGRQDSRGFYDAQYPVRDDIRPVRDDVKQAGNAENKQEQVKAEFNNPFKAASLFNAANINGAKALEKEKSEQPPAERRSMYAQPEFPYIPEPVKDFSYGNNPNPIINGDEYSAKLNAMKTQNEEVKPKREDADVRVAGGETRGYQRKDPEIVREPKKLEEIKAERAPDDYTGRYTVLPPEEDKSKKELFEGKVASFDELYPNLKPAKRAKEKDRDQIPIDEFISRAAENVKPTKVKKSFKSYIGPPLEMLDKIENKQEDSDEDIQEKARILEDTLAEFKVNAKVVEVTRGPAVTRYELQMPPGISVKNVEKYSEDIAYKLASNGRMRIETPIPGKTAVGIEVPNSKISIVGLREIIGSKEFDASSSPLTFALGKDIAGNSIVCNLIKMPHLLIAGATGSGKSACLNSLIVSLIYKSPPEDLRLILIDPKRVEFAVFADIPHLLTNRIINETEHTINAFNWAIAEMERRYLLLNKYKVKNIDEFNNSHAVKDNTESKLPYIVMVVDELADLMLNAKRDVEDKIRNIAQKARAAGIHLVLATQRPSVDVITGTIKANLPSRIAFAVSSFPDSKTILDQGGAESLLGRGDMLYSPVEMHEPIRIQGAYVTTNEVNAVVNFVKESNECIYDEEAAEIIFTKKEEPVSSAEAAGDNEDEYDTRLKDAARIGIELKQISISLVQRKLYIGYARAARIIDQLEKYKFISPFDGTSKARQVYMTSEDFKNFFGEEY